MLKYQTKNNIYKMDKIYRKTLLDVVLFIKVIRKLCVTSTEYFSIMDRYIYPIFLQTSRCVK